jgi:hypothetical protein
MLEEVLARCPFCGEGIPLEVDTSVPEQSYTEDCSVCCQPMAVSVLSRPGRVIRLEVDRE